MAVWQPWVPDEHPRPYHMNVIQVPLGKRRRWWWWWCSWSSTMATQSPWSRHILLGLRAIAIVHHQRLTTAANDCFLWLWIRYNFWIVRFSMREHIQPCSSCWSMLLCDHVCFGRLQEWLGGDFTQKPPTFHFEQEKCHKKMLHIHYCYFLHWANCVNCAPSAARRCLDDHYKPMIIATRPSQPSCKDPTSKMP